MLGTISAQTPGYTLVFRTKSEVGEYLKQLREFHHLTVQEVAGRIGYSDRNVRRDEAQGVYDVEKIGLYAHFYGVSKESIMLK